MIPEAGRILTRAAQVQGLVRIDAVFHFTAGAHAARATSSGLESPSSHLFTILVPL